MSQGKKIIHPIYIFFFFISLYPVLAQEAHIVPLKKSAVPIHLWVHFEENPSREAVISWSTTVPSKNNTLIYDTKKRNGETKNYSFKSTEIHSGPYTLTKEEKPMESWYHHAYLNNLAPNTRYYLTVESNGEKLGEYYFITAPADNTPVAMLIGGDSRLGDDRMDKENARRGMNARMSELLQENPEIIALAHSGDYTNSGHWSELYYWLNDHFEKTTTPDGRLLPLLPTRGNHDMLEGFEELFWWPNRKNNFYYTSNLNANTALVILNTEISINGDQRVWLENELKYLRKKKGWLTTLYHKAAFPSVRSYQDGEPQRRAWVPLFEKYKIDLSTSGHEHSLKRTIPILNLKPSAEGIVYIGDGGLGVRPREVDDTRWYFNPQGVAKSINNVHFIEYTSTHININAFGIDGSLLDNFSIPKNRNARKKLYRKELSDN